MNKPSGMVENNVLVGLDGQLFLFDGGQNPFAFSTGDLTPSAQAILDFSKNLEHRYSFLADRGIPYRHLIFPSKEIVLKEMVPPPWQERMQSLFLSRYVAAQPTLAGMACYPLESLAALNRKQPVFRMLDSHMTDFGTMALTQLVLEKWGLQYEVAEFFDSVLEKRPGDLADMLKFKDMVPEEFFKPKCSFHTFGNRSSLPGNTNNVYIVHHHKSLTKKQLLIFGDSFIKYSLPFFAPVFRDVVYVRSATFQADMVDLMKPDFVLSSNAERYLCKVEADTDSVPFIFNAYGKSDYSPPNDFIEAYVAQFSWRHHPKAYEDWSQRVQSGRLGWGGLGDFQPNNQIQVLNIPGAFRATGPDPSFYFPNAGLKEGKRYSVEFDLESDVKSIAKVYFQMKGDESFSDTRTVTMPVRIGNQPLKFVLPGSQLKSVLRIDPLACEGNFSVKNVRLKAIELITENKKHDKPIQYNGINFNLRPNLIIAGAQKAGTTSLATRLASHPQIYLPPEKELNFFNKPDFFRDMESYLERFSPGAEAAYRLDATPGYLWTERIVKDFVPPNLKLQPIPATIRALLGPQTKILIILRHPTFRAISAFFHQFRMGRIGTNDRIRHLQKNFGLVDIGFYSDHIDNYFKVFPGENIRIYFLEEYIGNKSFYDAEIYRWLGIDPNEQVTDAKENSNSNFKIEFSAGVLRLHDDIKQVRNLKKTNRHYAKMLEVIPPVVEEEDINFLNRVYVDELRKMRNRFPITIQIWPESPRLSDYLFTE